MARVDALLSMLQKVKQTSRNHWLACCPAHGDKSPSLSITDSDDVILLKCFAGCSAHEIVSAVGMDLSDLFPEREDELPKKDRHPFDPMAALEAIAYEAFVVGACASAMYRGDKLNKIDHDRLSIAIGRLNAAVDYVKRRNRG